MRASRNTVPPGTSIGRYQILSALGEGSMGAVLSAHDPLLGRRVALKLLHRHFARFAEERMEVIREIVQRLAHPHVVPIFETGTWSGQAYYTMELCEGGTLRRWLRDGPRPAEEVLMRFAEVACALAAAHQAGLLHGDLKPDNVLIGPDARARVTDFSLPEGCAARPDLKETGAPRCHGSPAYLPPESFTDEPYSARADQFSFCVALYLALCGAHPFPPRVPTVSIAEASWEVRPPPDDRPVPAWLWEVLVRGLSPDKEARFSSMEALLDALRASGVALP